MRLHVKGRFSRLAGTTFPDIVGGNHIPMDLQDWVKTSNQLRVELEEPLQIGNGQTGPFSGSLPEVRLYNRGLSDTQVAEIFERQRL